MAGEANKAIFITGGGSGIGQAVAKRFARAGWRMGLADVNAAGLRETAAMLPAGMADTYQMDVRDRDSWIAALDGEWHGDGIKVRDLIPGFIDTPLLREPVGGTNHSIRETVTGAGLEITSAGEVADAAWAAVHGDAVHTYVGKTAFRLKFAARWMPGQLRKRMRRGGVSE